MQRGICEVGPGTSMGVGNAPDRIEGTVKWFNAAKGYGFIGRDDGAKDVFVHHTAIEMDGYKELKDEQRVSFEVVRGSKGLQADAVRVL